MELAANEVGMIGNLDDLDVGGVGCRATYLEAATREERLVFPVELVTMTVALADFAGAVDAISQRVGLNHAGPGAKAHRSAHLFHAKQFAQLIDDTVLRCRVELAGVCVSEPADVARKLNAGRLHAQADAEVGDPSLARIPDS